MSRLVTFKLFAIPVTVQASFLLIAVLLGWTSGLGSVVTFLSWVFVVFVSIVLHELGHALVARSYGATVAIELNGFGGLTRWAVPEGELSPGQRAAVAAAGSAVGLVLGGLVWVISAVVGPFTGTLGLVVRLGIYVNVFWGLLNWLPIRPLDGGHLFSALLAKVVPQSAARVARVVFTITAAGALALAIYYRLIFVGILSAWLLLGELGLGQRSEQPAGLPTLSYDEPVAEPEDPPERMG
ncbi:MAG: hypothetical protein L0Z47_05535 [Actinobacteria bacterium]|nr:hypothetical protein [Actinomycetota bacterium]